jgi:lysophospholipid acyltransferase (LPLAT)-like uncharacterized protein
MASLSRLLGRNEFMLDAGSIIGAFLLKTLYLSLRSYHHYQDQKTTESLFREGKKVIFSFWHGRLLMLPFGVSTRQVAIMISQHRDGDFVSRFMEREGCQSIRGSATRGSLGAMKQMIASYRSGLHLAITPDGPKGPRFQVKSGVIELSKLTEAPIQPLTFGAFPRKVLDSWDEFVIPHPFSTCVFVWGKPLPVPADANKERIAELQGILQREMREITLLADELSRELSRRRRYGRKDIEADLVAQEMRKASE